MDLPGLDAAPVVIPKATAARAAAAKPKKPAKKRAPPQARSGQGMGQLPPSLPSGARALRPRRADHRVHGEQVWESRLDPTSELILTILTQNTADVNAEKAYEALRSAYPSDREPEIHKPGIGWGGDGLSTAPPARLGEGRVRAAVRAHRRHPAGWPRPRRHRLQATLRHIREQRGDYSLEFLGALPAIEARDWLTAIDGIGKKTASIVLLFCFGTPLMPVDRHVERVAQRIGLVRQGDRRPGPRPVPGPAPARCTRRTCC